MNCNQLITLLQVYRGTLEPQRGWASTTGSDLGYLCGNFLIEKIEGGHQTTERGDEKIRAILKLLE